MHSRDKPPLGAADAGGGAGGGATRGVLRTGGSAPRRWRELGGERGPHGHVRFDGDATDGRPADDADMRAGLDPAQNTAAAASSARGVEDEGEIPTPHAMGAEARDGLGARHGVAQMRVELSAADAIAVFKVRAAPQQAETARPPRAATYVAAEPSSPRIDARLLDEGTRLQMHARLLDEGKRPRPDADDEASARREAPPPPTTTKQQLSERAEKLRAAAAERADARLAERHQQAEALARADAPPPLEARPSPLRSWLPALDFHFPSAGAEPPSPRRTYGDAARRWDEELTTSEALYNYRSSEHPLSPSARGDADWHAQRADFETALFRSAEARRLLARRGLGGAQGESPPTADAPRPPSAGRAGAAGLHDRGDPASYWSPPSNGPSLYVRSEPMPAAQPHVSPVEAVAAALANERARVRERDAARARAACERELDSGAARLAGAAAGVPPVRAAPYQPRLPSHPTVSSQVGVELARWQRRFEPAMPLLAATDRAPSSPPTAERQNGPAAAHASPAACAARPAAAAPVPALPSTPASSSGSDSEGVARPAPLGLAALPLWPRSQASYHDDDPVWERDARSPSANVPAPTWVRRAPAASPSSAAQSQRPTRPAAAAGRAAPRDEAVWYDYEGDDLT
jgi:hypothetical protein